MDGIPWAEMARIHSHSPWRDARPCLGFDGRLCRASNKAWGRGLAILRSQAFPFSPPLPRIFHLFAPHSHLTPLLPSPSQRTLRPCLREASALFALRLHAVKVPLKVDAGHRIAVAHQAVPSLLKAGPASGAAACEEAEDHRSWGDERSHEPPYDLKGLLGGVAGCCR